MFSPAFVCLSAGSLKKQWTDFDEDFVDKSNLGQGRID